MVELLERHVGEGARHGVQVSYSKDWPRLLGTGGTAPLDLWAYPG